MPYKINNIELIIQPTTGQWIPREIIGIDGNGHPIYPATREFEMNWQLSNPTGTWQLQNFFDTVSITGSAVVDLPRHNYWGYEFYSYSGCVVQEPEIDVYFTEHITNVRLLVTKIKT